MEYWGGPFILLLLSLLPRLTLSEEEDTSLKISMRHQQYSTGHQESFTMSPFVLSGTEVLYWELHAYSVLVDADSPP